MEQVREIDGEQAYEKMRRAAEKASQERARQVERSSKLPVRKRPERRGPERGGSERDYGPAARSFSKGASPPCGRFVSLVVLVWGAWENKAQTE